MLRPFINKIHSVQRLCQNDEHEATLLDAIMSHVSEFALDVLPLYPRSVDQIVEILTEKIKPDSSKVIRGKMMALKADRNNLTEFTKKVENVAAQFKRSLIMEGNPIDIANERVIEDTIDLCRSNIHVGLINFERKRFQRRKRGGCKIYH